MTTYTSIPNSDVDVDSPITTELMTALRDNPIAITEGASGAPRVLSKAIDVTAVRAYRGSADQILSSSATSASATIIYNTEDYDTGSFYNNSTGVFAPTDAGLYHVSASARLATGAGSTDMDVFIQLVNESGAQIKRNEYKVTLDTGGLSFNVSGLVNMNGSTSTVYAVVGYTSGGLSAVSIKLGTAATVLEIVQLGTQP